MQNHLQMNYEIRDSKDKVISSFELLDEAIFSLNVLMVQNHKVYRIYNIASGELVYGQAEGK
jgi:hypothetical protein